MKSGEIATALAIKQSGIPVRYADAEISDFPVSDEIIQVRQWAAIQAFRPSLLIWGDIGTGKTHLAAALLREIIESDRSGYFISTIDLIDRIRQSFGNGDGIGDALLDRVKKEPVAVLDDLGAEKITDWVSDRLLAICNARYNDMLATVITSNYRPDVIAEHIGEPNGERIMSRLMQGCTIVHLTGKDRRIDG